MGKRDKGRTGGARPRSPSEELWFVLKINLCKSLTQANTTALPDLSIAFSSGSDSPIHLQLSHIFLLSSTLSLTAYKIRIACSRIGAPWQIRKGHVLVHINGQHVPPQRLYYFLFSTSPSIWKRASRTGHSSKPNRSNTANDKARNNGNKLR